MEYVFYIDPDLGYSHAEKHGVSDEEIREFFEDIRKYKHIRRDKSIEAIGTLSSGRKLIVSYRRLSQDITFIITAFDLEDKNKINFLDKMEEKL